jgi:hypothetical protein
LTNNAPAVEADIDKKAVNEKDLDLLVPGALFFWYIRECAPKSVIKFRKFKLDKSQLEDAERKAKELLKLLDW